jgi:hypothetical protein
VRGFGLELSEALSRDAAQEATTQAANSNTAAARLVDELKRLRPHAVDVAGGQLESASVVVRLQDGTEVMVDVGDLRGRWRWKLAPSTRRVSAPSTSRSRRRPNDRRRAGRAAPASLRRRPGRQRCWPGHLPDGPREAISRPYRGGSPDATLEAGEAEAACLRPGGGRHCSQFDG